MKAILTSMVLATASAFAQQAAPEPTLKAGSEVKLDAVTAAKWIQGEAPKAFEPGKIYMFECWATWCGPCVASIPHLNELYKKYHDKGLRVYGMNVSENDLEKVEKFVKAKGDGMSYPVAFTGMGSAFAKDWMEAGGVRGIPHAFIVKDGKILLTSHPALLTDEVIEELLSGDEGAKKAADRLNSAKDTQEKTAILTQEFRKASSSNDAETMATKLAELEKTNPTAPSLASMKLDLLITKQDWPAATKAIEELPEGPVRELPIGMAANKVSAHPDVEYQADFLKLVTKSYASLLADPQTKSSAISYLTLSTLQWKCGDKEGALTAAKKSIELAKNPVTVTGRKPPVAPFERFAKSVEDGTMPTAKEFSGWLKEAITKHEQPPIKTPEVQNAPEPKAVP